MKKLTSFAGAAVLVGVLIGPAVATAAPGGGGASGWHVGYYNPSSKTLSMTQAATSTGNLATFNFTNQDNTGYLIATQGKSILLGNDLGKTVTANFAISNAAATDFTYYGEDPTSGLPAASVRVYFQTSPAGGSSPTHYWWSKVAFQYLGNGSFSVTATLLPSAANWDTQNASYSDGAFNVAASNVTGIGFSFGGGNDYSGGVGTTDGSGTFTLTSFTVS